MKKNIIVLLQLLLFVCPVMAQDVNLSWDPSWSDNVAGYKVYYSQKNLNTLPLDGYGAAEGDSPLDIGNNLSATINNLDDNGVYYFSVTAYDSEGNESTYSNIVSTGWTPELYVPANIETEVTTPFVFSWESAPSDYDVSYILFYGTNKTNVTNAKILPQLDKQVPPNTSPLIFPAPIKTLIMATMLGLLGVVFFKRKWQMVYTGIILGALLASCTQGTSSSGASSSTEGMSISGTVATPLISLDMETSTSYQTTNLTAGTTYYWKVVAVDEVNTTQEYQSEVYSFTTAD